MGIYGTHCDQLEDLTPHHPNWRFHLLGVSIYLFGHGLAAAAPGHGQVALGTKKVARTWGARNGGPAREVQFARGGRQIALTFPFIDARIFGSW